MPTHAFTFRPFFLKNPYLALIRTRHHRGIRCTTPLLYPVFVMALYLYIKQRTNYHADIITIKSRLPGIRAVFSITEITNLFKDVL